MIPRIDVENLHVAPTLTKLWAICEDRQSVWINQNNVELRFTGYLKRTRDLWEIREVRKFVRALLASFPAWMFFLDRNGNTFNWCLLCLLNVKKVPDSDYPLLLGGRGVLDNGTQAIAELYWTNQFAIDSVKELTNSILHQIVGNFIQLPIEKETL